MSRTRPCGTCGGTGRMARPFDDRMKRDVFVRELFAEQLCTTCNGAGMVPDNSPIEEKSKAGGDTLIAWVK